MSTSIGDSQRNTNGESLSDIQKKYNKQKENLIAERTAEMEELRKELNKKEEALKHEDAAVINHIKKNSKDNIEKIRESELENIKAQKKMFVEENESIQKDLTLSKELQQKQIQQQSEIARKNIAKINETYKKESELLRKQKSLAIKNESDQFNNELTKNKEDHKNQILDLHSKYLGEFSNNERDIKESLQSQKALYSKALTQQKIKNSLETNKYSQRIDDPFYKLENRNSSFNETNSAYILKAFIPEHEKDNITIRVQGDKVTVQGLRDFQDSVKDDNRTLSTSSSQSFREEFKFEKPVFAKGALQERDGDYVKVTIPKVI